MWGGETGTRKRCDETPAANALTVFPAIGQIRFFSPRLTGPHLHRASSVLIKSISWSVGNRA